MNVEEAFKAMRKAADDYVSGDADGNDLHSAVVDYTDALWPNWPGRIEDGDWIKRLGQQIDDAVDAPITPKPAVGDLTPAERDAGTRKDNVTAISAQETGVFWAARIALFDVTMSDGSVRPVYIRISAGARKDTIRQQAMKLAEKMERS